MEIHQNIRLELLVNAVDELYSDFLSNPWKIVHNLLASPSVNANASILLHTSSLHAIAIKSY